MSKILLKLDNPSEIAKKFEDEFCYAVLVDNIKDLDNEGARMIIYDTKEDLEQGKGIASFPTEVMFENWFEYTAHYII